MIALVYSVSNLAKQYKIAGFNKVFKDCCEVSYCFLCLAKEKERQTPDERDHGRDGYSVRESECESVGLWHDRGGALLPVHPQPLQPARHRSGWKVRTNQEIPHTVDQLYSLYLWQFSPQTIIRWENLFSFYLCFSPCSYALPTKSTEIMLMQDQGTKMYVDAVLKTHERVVQVKLTCSKAPLSWIAACSASCLRNCEDLTVVYLFV